MLRLVRIWRHVRRRVLWRRPPFRLSWRDDCRCDVLRRVLMTSTIVSAELAWTQRIPVVDGLRRQAWIRIAIHEKVAVFSMYDLFDPLARWWPLAFVLDHLVRDLQTGPRLHAAVAAHCTPQIGGDSSTAAALAVPLVRRWMTIGRRAVVVDWVIIGLVGWNVRWAWWWRVLGVRVGAI